MKKQNPGDGHDRSTAGQNGGDGRERSALLEEQEECDCASADADAGENGIKDPSTCRSLIPTARQPKKSEIKQDRQRGSGFDNESAQSFADVVRR